MTEETITKSEIKKESPMKNVLYAVLAIFFLVTAGAVYVALSAVNRTTEAIQPVGAFVQDLFVPATAVILPDPTTIVLEINDLARLETASYVAEKVIRAEKDDDFLFGAFSETILFVAYGEVIAGVDLAKMEPSHMQVIDPNTVAVYMPEVEIFVATLDNDRSYVADRDNGFLTGFTGLDPDLETEVRRTAEDEILSAAVEAGILETADTNAQNFMEAFLNGLGFETVIFTDSPPPPAPEWEQPLPKGYSITPVAP